jgi:hypothetical protein
MRSSYSLLSLFFWDREEGYVLVDSVDLYFLLDGLLRQYLIFLDLILLFLQLLPEELHTIAHGIDVLALFLDLVLLVEDR